MSCYGEEWKIIAKSIITQDGNVVNYNNLLAIYIDEELDDDENIIGYNLLGVVGMNKNSDAILLGFFNDEKSAMNAKADIIRWLQSEEFSTFEMPTADEGGDV